MTASRTLAPRARFHDAAAEHRLGLPSRITCGGRLALLVVGLIATGCGAPDDDAPDAAAAADGLRPNSHLLVAPEQLAERIGDPDLVVLYVGQDSMEYLAGHIPGARFLLLGRIIEEREGVPNLLAPPQRLQEIFQAAGVSDHSQVVLYDDGGWLPATRTFFTLDYLGHEGIAVLDGGLPAWTHAVGELSRTPPEPVSGSMRVRPRGNVVVDASWIHRRLEDPDLVLIDARPPEQFRGEISGGVPRPGHIPGARNRFWQEALRSEDDSRLRDPASLRSWFAEAGLHDDATVVTYCRTGVQSSHSYFALRYLGYQPLMYDGSFIDWSPRAELPVAQP